MTGGATSGGRGIKGTPLTRTPAQVKAADRAAEKKAAADDLAVQESAADEVAARIAQIANLVIAGHTFESIGKSIGASAAEVERMLNADTPRYVRTQASLRVWVRNWISSKYADMIAADIGPATDPTHPDKLENQDRVVKMLNGMERLHGAAAPTQSEVKVEAAPEAIEKMVNLIAASSGVGYDPNIFDLDPDEVIEVNEAATSAPAHSLAALEAASRHVEEPQPQDTGLDASWEGRE